ncbi:MULTISPECIES: adhesin [Bacillus]|uniref:adhesin n=1 Tax=Bacillus TaxID=1386 RepID=UPI000BB84C20|nr:MULTISPECIES: adhesin [Bacillus]
MLQITDNAKEMIQTVLKENGAEGIRLFEVDGCCGPQFALSLDAPEENDHVETINGVVVAMEEHIVKVEGLVLDLEESENGTGLVLIGADGCC